MSSAKEGEHKAASCLHESRFMFDFFHRAKPVSERNRRFSERALRCSGKTNTKRRCACTKADSYLDFFIGRSP